MRVKPQNRSVSQDLLHSENILDNATGRPPDPLWWRRARRRRDEY